MNQTIQITKTQFSLFVVQEGFDVIRSGISDKVILDSE